MSTSIISRIKKVFKKEDKNNVDPQKRTLRFEHLENREMLAVVSLGASSYNLTSETPMWCCGVVHCEPVEFAGCYGYCYGNACDIIELGHRHLHVPVNVDLSNHHAQVPKCFDIKFEIIKNETSETTGSLNAYYSYVSNGTAYENLLVTGETTNSNGNRQFTIPYFDGMTGLRLEVQATSDSIPETNFHQPQIRIMDSGKHMTYGSSGGSGCGSGCCSCNGCGCTCCFAEIPYYEVGQNGTATIRVTDDDHWKVNVTAHDAVAVERLLDVEQDNAYFKFTRTGGDDRSYPISVQFTVMETYTPDGLGGYTTDSATYNVISSAQGLPSGFNYTPLNTFAKDYNFGTTKYTEQSLKTQEIAALCVSEDVYRYRDVFVTNFAQGAVKGSVAEGTGVVTITRNFTCTLPALSATQEYYYSRSGIDVGYDTFFLRLSPTFDWEDEGELFDPSGTAANPGSQTGEKLRLALLSNPSNPTTATKASECGVWWSGLYHAKSEKWHNPVASTAIVEVEIKDGAIAKIMADANNNGTFEYADYLDRRNAVGSLLVTGVTEKAEYYAWIDVVGSHILDVRFSGLGSVEYVSAYNVPNNYYYFAENNWWPTLSSAGNLAKGHINVQGAASASASVTSDQIKLNVTPRPGDTAPGTSDWARMTVFTINVDMAFNHDRTNNSGSDGINIRQNGNDNMEHHGPEFTQNGINVSLATDHGSTNQKTVLYLKDQSVKVYNRFVMTPAIPGGITLKLQADANGVAIGGLSETSVTFGTNGISNGSKSVAGVAGFVEFSATSNTAASVQKEEGTFDWNVTQIKDKTTGTGEALTTDPITFYTVLNVPNDPWDVNDSHPATVTPAPGESLDDNKNQPWVVVLDILTDSTWCRNQNNYDTISATVTSKLSTLFKYEYVIGGCQYYANSSYYNMTALKNLLKGGGRSSANCLDIAWATVALSNLLGDGLVVKNIYNITSTTTNWVGFDTNIIQSVGSTVWDTTRWGYHAVAARTVGTDIYIYDACIKFNQTSPFVPIKTLWSTYSTLLSSTPLKLEDTIFTFQFFW